MLQFMAPVYHVSPFASEPPKLGEALEMRRGDNALNKKTKRFQRLLSTQFCVGEVIFRLNGSELARYGGAAVTLKDKAGG
jgi:hypothetical protein